MRMAKQIPKFNSLLDRLIFCALVSRRPSSFASFLAMNVPLDATAELPEEHKQALLQSIEKTQLRDRSFTPSAPSSYNTSVRSMRMYNSLVERCFSHCVNSFRSKTLDSTEENVLPLFIS